MGKSITELIAQKNFKEYVFSNNCFKSLNHLINSLIAVNNNVSITRFELILKILFVRMEYKNSEDSQIDESLVRKSS